MFTPASISAGLAAAALALAPAASASTHDASTSSRPTALPAASAVLPTPGKQATITPGNTATSPSGASLDWAIPACRGTVYASFILNQGQNVYLHEHGTATAYPCRSTPQTVTVRYSPADPSQGALVAGHVSVTVTTKPAATGSRTYQTRTSTRPAVTGAAPVPDASKVVLTPAAKQVAITVTNQQFSPAYATVDWTLPACTGTVYAYFQLDQKQSTGTQTYVQEKGSTAYPCSSTPQTLHVRYHPVDPSAKALTAGDVDLTTTTYVGATNQPATTSSATLPGVLTTQSS